MAELSEVPEFTPVRPSLLSELTDSVSYELALAFANSGHRGWRDFLADDQRRPGQKDAVPFRPASAGLGVVYSFGYTHAEVNGTKVHKGNLDFYPKGPAELLLTDGDPLAGTATVFGGGIEVEYCAMYCVNDKGDPVYLGYTLANDFSDAGLRSAHRNLANLSKLHPSVLSGEVLLGDLPPLSPVTARVERDGAVLWERQGRLGSRAMIYSRALLERLLLGRRTVFRPGTVVYLLLGSCISSHKDGVELVDGDLITIRDHGCGLALTNRYHG